LSAVGRAEYQVDEHTIALYHFDEGSGEIAHDETGNYDATFLAPGEPAWTTDGRFGPYALDFDGANDYIRNDFIFDNTPPYNTIDFWMKPDVTLDQNNYETQYFFIINKPSQAVTARWDGSLHVLRFYIENVGNDYIDYSGNFNAGQWYHLSFSWGAEGMKMWVDDILVSSGSSTRNIYPGSDFNFWFGDTSNSFHGKIDELRISDITRYPRNVMVNWHFNEGSGTNVYDSVGGLNNLTLTSDTMWVQDGYSNYAINTFMSQYAYQDGTLLDSFPDDGSVEMWIRPNNTINPQTDINIQTIFSKAGKWSNPSANFIDVQWCGIYCGNSYGKLIYELYKDGSQYKVYSNTTNWLANRWYKITFTWGSLGMQLYVDNVLEGTNSFTGKPSYGSDRDVGIGYNLRIGGYYFDGSIDEVKISNIQTLPMLLELDHIGNRNVNVNETLIIDLNATYEGFGNITYYTNAAEVLPSAFSFDNVTGVFIWTPEMDEGGFYDVIFGVTDGEYSDEETITITVDGPPVINPIGNKEVNEGSQLNINVNAYDPDNESLTYYTNAAQVLPSQFSFDGAQVNFHGHQLITILVATMLHST
jgi:hypothetical protein